MLGTRTSIEPRAVRSEPTIALLPWGEVIEEWLCPLGLSLENFRDDEIGSWMFGFAAALRLAGVETVVVVVSNSVETPVRWTHRHTGATIRVLPASRMLRWVGGRTRQERRSRLTERNRIVRALEWRGARLRTQLGPYVSTPLLMLAETLRSEGCTSILCQEYEYPRFDACVLLGRLMRLPVFGTFQGVNATLTRLERPFRPFAIRACDGLVIGARSEAERVSARYGLPLRKIARIFNPLDLTFWQPRDKLEARAALGIASDAQVVAWHGPVRIQEKGLDVLLAAWDRVCRERPVRPLELLLVGSGADSPQLHRLIADSRSARVRWRDQFVIDRRTIRQHLSAADVYAFPSRSEGFPVAPLEAMACGLPVVAASAAGVPDILENDEESGGLIVPSGNPDALAFELGRVLDSEGLRLELGQRARARVESSFGAETIGAQLRDFLLPRDRRPGDLAA